MRKGTKMSKEMKARLSEIRNNGINKGSIKIWNKGKIKI